MVEKSYISYVVWENNMKRILLFIIPVLLLLSCRKEQAVAPQTDEQIVEEYKEELRGDTRIDFAQLEQTVKNSESINIEVFIAISVLHRYYSNRFVAETESMNEDEQVRFYQEKRKEFFGKIKYSEEQYESYMENNMEALNSYITQHPEMLEYLTTIN